MDDEKASEICKVCGGACCRYYCFPYMWKDPDIAKWINKHDKVEVVGKLIYVYEDLQEPEGWKMRGIQEKTKRL